MFTYPATFSLDEECEQYAITFRDLENAQAFAFTADDIELDAADALSAAVGELIDSRLPVPLPSPARDGEMMIHLPLLTCLKAALSNAMLATGTAKASLARKLSLNAAQMERLLDVSYASKVELLEQALYLVGYEATVAVAPLKPNDGR